MSAPTCPKCARPSLVTHWQCAPGDQDCSDTYRRADCTEYAACRLHRAPKPIVLSPFVRRALANALPPKELAR